MLHLLVLAPLNIPFEEISVGLSCLPVTHAFRLWVERAVILLFAHFLITLDLVFGVFVFVGLVSVWLIPFAEQIGWAELGNQLQAEVPDRVVDHDQTGRIRGAFFYVRTLSDYFSK